MTFVRLEHRERPGAPGLGLAPGADLHGPVDDYEPRALLHLVLAELLSGRQRDEDGARVVLGVEHDGIPRPVRSVDRAQIPRTHARPLTVTTLDCPMTLVVDRYELGVAR